ncbi:MAG: hypothetical protein UW46_C0013G0004 [Candidatus Yanofskybacteria bacterium GW2011_GWF1_44_227]|uniref:Uncharacterized protein n=1 Tax=Candidatus Yanofskybacteria bacterium GW2011_GWE2_40_11 TaxID=1619033 RepID=A0A0G0TPK2_9BACT|nr:MAG: hypothetical protein UT75_C0013G0014 [Candidatus Yanofskybacteria bacterium GW2011_GWE2_40_11]KKT14930.1 MAG: hypothetical protein UV97_C0014G0004 [Candidatus Yanofskybacteria bacterium GW2011_GWF2_43_596]KKT52703.1 MAG: hypothetical protein UW46_C0013G0004 [Candidatus Yanofskybacteria bacterium GW2011_GWF1_44_227]OGN35805.1 MAG: hypothetical protein A2207_03830 [Candidatus Yanofskybacteria bacterium RIFOXYA1_FULL_44_17]OGN35824.1 MAG: hypothetical protein A2241_03570 [Candidatus Yanofs
MANNKELPSREELQEEFRGAKMLRDIQRTLKEHGIDISIEAVKATVAEYERLHSEALSESDSQEVAIDGDMIKAPTSNDSNSVT